MKKIRSHFRFSRGQRNGIFLLISLILIVQLVIISVNRSMTLNSKDSLIVMNYQRHIDSLKQLPIKQTNKTLFPFNPNFITDYKGYTLGMSNEEIDRLIEFREQGKWINSSEQFQMITKISDSLLAVISPFFKFPEWVTHPTPISNVQFDISTKTYSQKLDLNTATSEQLMRVKGIGEVLSKRIIEYRSSLESGFASEVQLQEVYGLTADVIESINLHFAVKTPAVVKKLNINEASRDQLVSIDYIDYELAYNIIQYRTLHDGFKSLDELKKVTGFPLHRFDLIKLYLQL